MTGTRRQAARRVRPFTPSQESPAVLSGRTVGRESTLETMVARLVDAARTGNRAHTMLVGPRGSGKTHLLNVALHRARQQVDVERRLVVVRFDEDAIGVHRYTDILAEAYAGVAASGSRRPRLSDTPEWDIAEALGDRVLVLAMENADRIFKSLGKQGQQAFRAWVEQSQQIFVLASSPSLFKGIQDRALPWWGNFGVHHLQELSLDEGRELLIKLARESGDHELAEFLTTPKAEGRLRAINALAGGSPRVWMILSECLTVETLDELVPAVEALLEGLVPYYQQLLWDLSDVEQRLVRELADGPHHAATVQELAAACEIDQRVAASTLKRLADMRWVRADKSPELDRRHTWYRLREPLVRHHFQYRSARDQPLPLIVELLKAWYDPEELREQLVRALPGSETERLIAATFPELEAEWVKAYLAQDITALRADARFWLHGGEAGRRTADAGLLIDVLTSAVLDGPEAAVAGIKHRKLSGQIEELALAIVGQVTELPAGTPEERIGLLLRSTVEATRDEPTSIVLELISALWDSSVESESSEQRLKMLMTHDAVISSGLLKLDIGAALYYMTFHAGKYRAASAYLDTLAALLAEHNISDNTILSYLSRAAWLLAQAGDFAEASERLTKLLPAFVEAYGETSESVLSVGVQRAWFTSMAGDPVSACRRLREIIPICDARLGADHDLTKEARLNLAISEGMAGEPAKAISAVWPFLDKGNMDAEWIQSLQRIIGSLFKLLMQAPGPVDDRQDNGLIATLQAAAAGEEEALMRLPAELADIVRAARAEKAAASG